MGDVVNLRATDESAIHELHRDNDPIGDDLLGVAPAARSETGWMAAKDPQDAVPQRELTGLVTPAAVEHESQDFRPTRARVCACDSPLPCIDESDASCAKCGCSLDPVRHLRLLIAIQRRRQPLRPAESAAFPALAG
jgi:hypothetical protein